MAAVAIVTAVPKVVGPYDVSEEVSNVLCLLLACMR